MEVKVPITKPSLIDSLPNNVVEAEAAINNILEVKLSDQFSDSIGDVRSVYLGDPYPGEVIERLDGYEEGLSLTYSIVDKSCLPMLNYVACVNLKEISSNETDVTWCSHFIPDGATADEIVELLESLYYLIFDNIEEQYKNSQS